MFLCSKLSPKSTLFLVLYTISKGKLCGVCMDMMMCTMRDEEEATQLFNKVTDTIAHCSKEEGDLATIALFPYLHSCMLVRDLKNSILYKWNEILIY